MMWWLWLACSSPEPVSEVTLSFVRDGVVLHGGSAASGRPLAGGRHLLQQPWTPGQTVSVQGTEAVAPRQADCVTLFSVPLGDVSSHVRRGGGAPDTRVVFSPDGAALAVGTFRGEVLVVDAWTGQVRARRTLAETMVKQLAWSADGKTLYAAEQSPDALVHALDPASLASRWTVRLAELVGSSPPPPGDDVFGVYTLPGAYGLEVMPDGALLVAAVHAWGSGSERRNASRLLRITPEGTVAATWPKEHSLDGTLMHPAVEPAGDTVAVFVGRSASGAAPEGVPVGAVQLLSWPTLEPETVVRPEPLAPWYDRVFPWEGVAVRPGGDRVVVGLTDGRVLLAPVDGGASRTLEPGSPVMAGAVPLVASVGHVRQDADHLYAATSETHIPWGAAAPDVKPPSAHPRERSVFAWREDGGLDWTWSGAWAPQGLALSPDGDELVMGAGDRSDDRTDLFGALVFDLDSGGSGADRLRAVCSTESPVFYRFDVSADGRIALVEHPEAAGGDVRGAYRLTVAR